MHINQLLFTELLVLEMSRIMLPKSQLLCTTYIVLYKKLKVIACQLPKDNTAYFDILKWLIWTFSTLEFLEITPLSVSYKFALINLPYMARSWSNCLMLVHQRSNFIKLDIWINTNLSYPGYPSASVNMFWSFILISQLYNSHLK